MGNAIRDPARFFEKKIEHEIFGLPDPKFPNHKIPQETLCRRQHMVDNTICSLQPNTKLENRTRSCLSESQIAYYNCLNNK